MPVGTAEHGSTLKDVMDRTISSVVFDKVHPTPINAVSDRIVNCYHELDASDQRATFAERNAMRNAIWDAVEDACPLAIHCDKLQDPAAVIELDVEEDASVQWHICLGPLYARFTAILRDNQPASISS